GGRRSRPPRDPPRPGAPRPRRPRRVPRRGVRHRRRARGAGVTRVVVVGAGVTGLAPAWLARPGPRDEDGPADVDVTVVEAADRVGGKILTVPFDGLALDVGADAFLARRPEAARLARRLG